MIARFQLDDRVRLGDRDGEIVATVGTTDPGLPIHVVRLADGETRLATEAELSRLDETDADDDASYEIASADHVVPLSTDQWTFVLDLLSHSAEVLGDLIGHPDSERVENLIVSTRAAFGVETTEPQTPEYTDEQEDLLRLVEERWFHEMKGELRVERFDAIPGYSDDDRDHNLIRTVLTLARHSREMASLDGETLSDVQVARRIVAGLIVLFYGEEE